jgi:hypothetical protein
MNDTDAVDSSEFDIRSTFKYVSDHAVATTLNLTLVDRYFNTLEELVDENINLYSRFYDEITKLNISLDTQLELKGQLAQMNKSIDRVMLKD